MELTAKRPKAESASMLICRSCLPNLFSRRRADHRLVEHIADRHHAGAQIDAEYAAFALMPRGDQSVIAGRLRPRALAGRIAQGDANRAAVFQAILAGADLATRLVEPIDPVEIGLRRGEKIVIGGLRGARRQQKRKCAQSFHRNPRPSPNHWRPDLIAEAAPPGAKNMAS